MTGLPALWLILLLYSKHRFFAHFHKNKIIGQEEAKKLGGQGSGRIKYMDVKVT